MTRVLVTGATGFIGRRVVAHLTDGGFEVHGLARRPPDERTSGVQWHGADLLSPEGGSAVVDRLRPELLVHCAWEATPGRFWAAIQNIDWVAATLRLFRAFAAAGGRRAVFAGTCAEYDWSHAVLSEIATPLAPSTLYGKAKAATFTLLDATAESLGVSFAWGRVFFLYGPNEAPRRLVSDVVEGLLNGRSVDCSEGRQQRDFMHVDDVARAFAAIAASDHRGPVNIASGCCIPVRAVIEEIARQIGRPDLVRLGARPSPPGDPDRLEADTGRLAATGFVPRYDLAEGIADTIAWCRSAGLVDPASRA